MNELWENNFFKKSALPSYEDLSATKVRKALSERSDVPVKERKVGEGALTEAIPEGVIDYIIADTKEGRQLRFLYPLENQQKDAEKLARSGNKAEAIAVYEEILKTVTLEKERPEIQRQAEIGVLDAVIKNLRKELGKISASSALNDNNKQEDAAFAGIVGLEIAKRIHAREGKEAEDVKKESEAKQKEGQPISKFYEPTKQAEFKNRIKEAVLQVKRRHEYKIALVNPWANSEEELRATISKLTEEFAKAIFRQVAVEIGLDITPHATAAQLADTLRKTKLDVSESIAKFAVYSGPPGGGKGEVWKEFLKLYGDMTEKFVLFHSRGIRSGEKMGKDYHYRNEAHIKRLAQEGKIITVLVNGQLQGLATKSFEDEYSFIDPNTQQVHSGQAKIAGLDNVFKGNKLVVAEVGLGWFEALRKEYQEKLMSIFISPFSDEYLGEAVKNKDIAFASIVGLEIAQRMHNRETKEARAVRDVSEARQKNGEKIEKSWTPTAQKDFENRINEAALQVKRRHEYQAVLVNTTANTEAEKDIIIGKLAEEFAFSIFSRLVKAMGLEVTEGTSAKELADRLAKMDLSSYKDIAKLPVFSGPPREEKAR